MKATEGGLIQIKHLIEKQDYYDVKAPTGEITVDKAGYLGEF